MAVIRDKFVVEDGFSSGLDRYTEKCNTANKALEHLTDTARSAAEWNAQWEASQQASQPSNGKLESLKAEIAANMDLYRAEQQAAAMRQRAAEEARVAAEEAARAEERAEEAAERHAQRMEYLKGILPGIVGHFRDMVNAIAGTQTPLDSFMKRMQRTVLMMFSARRVITYIKNALKRAPEEMSAGLSQLGTMVKDGFDRTVLSIVRGFLPAVDKLKAAFEGVPNLTKALGQGLELIGQGIGFVIEKVAELVTWMGNNLETVLTAAAILLGLVAVKFLAVAAAAVMANFPLIMIVTLVGGMAAAFINAGGTAESVVEKIGAAMGWLYATVYNIVADLWNNALAPFAEAFATMLDNPVEGIMQLLVNLASFALSVLGKIAAGIDALFGSNLAGAVNGWKDGLDTWAGEQFATAGAAGRMTYKNPTEVSKTWGEKASGIADKFTANNLERYQLTELQDINANTGATAKAVDMAAEDLKSFVDMAERDYVMRVNLQTPTINITGQNTGNTKEDAEYLADRIAGVLADMRASSPSVPVDYLYSGSVG